MKTILNISQKSWWKFTYEFKTTFVLAFPIIIAQLIHMSMSFVDTVMTGNLSAQDLAAVSVGHHSILLFEIFGISIISAIQPIIAQMHGARGKKPAVGIVVVQGIFIGQLFAILLLIGAEYAHLILPLFSIDSQVVDISARYIRAYSWRFPASFVMIALINYYSGITNTKIAMYISIGALCINIVGNYILIFGNLGAPQLGAQGAGYTSALASWIGMIAMVIYTLKNKKYRDYKIFRQIHKFDLTVMKEIFRIGSPIGFSTVFEVGLFSFFTLLTGRLGLLTIAGNQIALNFASITFMIPLALSQATAIRVGNYIGKQEIDLAKYVGYIGYLISFMVMSTAAFIMIVFPHTIAGFYTIDLQVQEIASGLLVFAGIFQISDGIQVAGMGALKGFKDTKVPMIVNLFSYWAIGVTLGYYFCFNLGYGASGLWTGLILGLTTAAILHAWRFSWICKTYSV